jgi:hypothetical protein
MHSGVDARIVLLLPLLSGAVVGCGETASVEQASDGGQDAWGDGLGDESSGDDGPAGSNDVGAHDALLTVPIDAGHAITCTLSNWSVITGVETCAITASETCSDGNGYSVSCSCPMCSCTRTNEGGSATSPAAYAGCPMCAAASTALVFSGCPF